MKIFAAIESAETIRAFYEKTGIKLNYLISYAYLKGQAYRTTVEYRDMVEQLYLDSGAYSVYTGKLKISVIEYQRYLRLYGNKFDGYFNLDDDFDDPEHNQLNQQYLKEGLPKGAKDPIPVVHDNKDPFAEFKKYADMEHEFIALGSTVRIPNKVYEQIIEKYPQIKVHFFGNLRRKLLFKYRPYSADSSEWATAAGNGIIHFWNEDAKKEYYIWVGGRDKPPPKPVIPFKDFKHREKLEAFLSDTFGYSYPVDLMPLKAHLNRQIINLYFFKQLENYINSLD
jgi:hypothetical protein